MKDRVLSLIKVLAPVFLFAAVIVAACFAAEGSTENDAFPSLRNGGAVTVTDTFFTGRGTIRSFDVDAQGNVLVCIEPNGFGLKRHKYLMLLRPDGSLLRTYEYYGNHSPTAGFTEDGNIVVYQARDTRAVVIDTQGNVLYTYTDKNAREAGQLNAKSHRCYGETDYYRNFVKSKITVRHGHSQEEVFFEIPSADAVFLLFWLLLMTSLLGASRCIFRAHTKALREAHPHFEPPEGPDEEELYGCFTGEDPEKYGCFLE